MERCPKCGWYHTDECMGGSMVADHNPTIRSTRTPILVSAMRLLAQEIQSEDGVANAALLRDMALPCWRDAAPGIRRVVEAAVGN